MGGSVIVEAARQLPQSLIGVIGVDTFQDIDRQPTQADINTLMEPMREDFETSTKNFVCQILFTPDADTTLMATVAEDMASSPKEIALSALESAWTYDMRAAFANVRVPIRGINSDFYPVNIDAGKRHASSFEITFMSGVGHFLMMEDPVTFNRHLEDTIQALMHHTAGG
jgi:pimeloyl-ACP methyl ester carboxylesterase